MTRTTHTHWPGPSAGEDIDLIPEGAELPCDVSGRGPTHGILISGAVGAMFLLASIAVLKASGWSGVDRLIGGTILGAFGLGSLVLCWHCTRRTRSRITAKEVECTVLSGLRTVRWREPTSAYAGVLRRTTVGGSEGNRRLLHEILLHHPVDKHKSVKLYSSDSGDGFLDRHRHYALTFGLPALTEAEDGVEAVALEDLDRPLRQRLRKDPQGVVLPPGPAPRDLSIAIQADAVTMRTRRKLPLSGLAAGLFLAATGAFILYAGWQTFRVHPPLWRLFLTLNTVVGVLLIAGGLAAMLAGLIAVQVLRADAERIESWYEVGSRTFGHRGMAARSVREVTVGRFGAHPMPRPSRLPRAIRSAPVPYGVTIAGEDETIQFGRILANASQRWVRSCVLSVLAAGAAEDDG